MAIMLNRKLNVFSSERFTVDLMFSPINEFKSGNSDYLYSASKDMEYCFLEKKDKFITNVDDDNIWKNEHRVKYLENNGFDSDNDVDYLTESEMSVSEESSSDFIYSKVEVSEKSIPYKLDDIENSDDESVSDIGVSEQSTSHDESVSETESSIKSELIKNIIIRINIDNNKSFCHEFTHVCCVLFCIYMMKCILSRQ